MFSAEEENKLGLVLTLNDELTMENTKRSLAEIQSLDKHREFITQSLLDLQRQVFLQKNALAHAYKRIVQLEVGNVKGQG